MGSKNGRFLDEISDIGSPILGVPKSWNRGFGQWCKIPYPALVGLEGRFRGILALFNPTLP
jgi:hypothetical protein